MPLLLDLFCGAGGAAMGYHRAGFEVVGVDIAPQPDYPFAFVRGDALEYLRRRGDRFDAIHASPPCQLYSRATKQNGKPGSWPDLIAPTRAALPPGRPYVIENVEFARSAMIDPVLLCGAMFPPLFTYRHRLFECNFPVPRPRHPRHTIPCPRSNVYEEGKFLTVAGHVSPIARAFEAMGIDWPMNRRALVEAIPPAFTEHIGRALARYLTSLHRLGRGRQNP